MVRKRSAKPGLIPRPEPQRPVLQRAPNRQLPSQTRKVLAKHYRAKYGVR